MSINIDLNELIIKALNVAISAHEGDTRKGDKNIPYIIHPIEVALILQENGMEKDIIAAGLLHDTLEDTDLKKSDIKKLFNKKILRLVLGASEKLENRNKTPWEKRKEHTVTYLNEKADFDIKCISCADKLSNLRSMIRNYKLRGNDIWEKFNRGYQKQKWYYRSLVDSLSELEGVKMYDEFKAGVKFLFK